MSDEKRTEGWGWPTGVHVVGGRRCGPRLMHYFVGHYCLCDYGWSYWGDDLQETPTRYYYCHECEKRLAKRKEMKVE